MSTPRKEVRSAANDMATATPNRFKPRTDPVTFEVLRHRLWQINDEQGKTIISVSGSPVASEGNDFNVALTNADGEIVAVGPYIVIHVSAISMVVRNAIAMFGNDGICEGDMYLCNDPWLGAGHQNDVSVIQPVFWKGERIAWTASVIHQVDVGGPYPGSWNPKARSVFDEAPRYRLLRVVRGGKLQPEVVETYFANSRFPTLVELDLRAQVAAANVARDRIEGLMRRYGAAVVKDSFEDSLDYSQMLFQQRLRGLPDGEWYAEDYLDHDGHDEKVYTVCCRLHKQGDKLTFDFSGTSVQAPGFINCTESGAYAGVYGAVYPYLCRMIPWNAGVLRQVELKIDAGTVHHATFPAPVGFGVVHASWTTMNAAALAIGKMLTSSADTENGAMAVWSGSTFVYNLFGEHAGGERFATMLLSSDLQGCGARSFADGYDVGGKLNAPRAKVSNIESIEASYPVMYLYRRRVPDSGGAGKWRGGVSAEVAFTPRHARHIDLTVNTLGTAVSSTNGLAGGYPGGGVTVALKKRSDIVALWQRGRLPLNIEDLAGETSMLPGKCAFSLEDGDVFVAIPHGGGGIGDPLDRDPVLVLHDVIEGAVSRELAGSMYGVVFAADSSVDSAATLQARAAIRARRLSEAKPAEKTAALRPPAVSYEVMPMGPYLVGADGIFCGGCKGLLSADAGEVKAYLPHQRQHLAEAGPWVARRWSGDSPWFDLWKYFCPHCAQLLAVEQHQRGEDKHWEDYRVTVPAPHLKEGDYK